MFDIGDDLKLWGRIRTGDILALKVLHDRYYYQLFLYTRKLFHNNQGNEEAVSDCFIKIWTKRHEIEIERSVKAYLFLMVRNNMIDILRKSRGIIQLEDLRSLDLPDEETNVELDQFSRLYEAMERLPKQRRKILELAVFESLKYTQIAAKLNISVNTVKTQMGRAYRFLKEELDAKSLQLFFMLRIR
jgi:RNA polymerase sigma-70 factor (ECF subfamily)